MNNKETIKNGINYIKSSIEDVYDKHIISIFEHDYLKIGGINSLFSTFALTDNKTNLINISSRVEVLFIELLSDLFKENYGSEFSWREFERWIPNNYSYQDQFDHPFQLFYILEMDDLTIFLFIDSDEINDETCMEEINDYYKNNGKKGSKKYSKKAIIVGMEVKQNFYLHYYDFVHKKKKYKFELEVLSLDETLDRFFPGAKDYFIKKIYEVNDWYEDNFLEGFDINAHFIRNEDFYKNYICEIIIKSLEEMDDIPRRDEFFKNVIYKRNISENFMISLLTSEYQYRSSRANPGYDNSFIILGYIQAAEILLAELLSLKKDSDGDDELYNSTIGELIIKLKQQLFLNEIDQSESKSVKEYLLRYLTYWKNKIRNGYVHKDFLTKDNVDKTRRESLRIIYMLITNHEIYSV